MYDSKKYNDSLYRGCGRMLLTWYDAPDTPARGGGGGGTETWAPNAKYPHGVDR